MCCKDLPVPHDQFSIIYFSWTHIDRMDRMDHMDHMDSMDRMDRMDHMDHMDRTHTALVM